MVERREVQKNNVFEFEGGDVQLWIEQESIHVLACDKNHHEDPAELTPDTARQLAQKLSELADLLEN